MSAVRSTRIAARLWWWLLPYAGETGYADEQHPARWRAYPLTWAWQLVGKLPGSAPFKPSDLPPCTCDWCRGVPGAEWTP